MEKVENLLEQLAAFTTEQVVELRSKLEVKWGVSATIAAAPSNNEPVAIVKVEPTEFAVVMTAFTNKMGAIKVYRELTAASLLESKAFVEGALPREVKTGLAKDQAEDIKAKLEAAGATAEVKPVQ